MDTPKVSQMWTELQKANRLPQPQTLLGAETELQELMRQIDVMVQSRKGEWEREKQGLVARLEVREHEYNIQKATLEHKHQEIGHLRAQLETVEQCQRNSSQDYENQLSGVRDEVASMKKEYEKLHRRYSRHLKDKTRGAANSEASAVEVKRLQDKLQEYRQRCRIWEQKQRDYEKQIGDLGSSRQALEEKCRLSPTSADVEILHDAHRGEIEGLRREMVAVTTEVHDRDITIATLTEKMSGAERQAREHNDLLEQKQAEIQVAQAQLNALRLENQHLRSSAMTLGGATNMDIAEVERHLQGLQGAYSLSVSTLEGQNEKLQSHILALKDQLHSLTDDTHSRLQTTLLDTQRTLQDQCKQQARKLSEVQEDSQRRLQAQEEHTAATVSQYEHHIASLQSQLIDTEGQLDAQNQAMRRLGLEHGVMSHFVEGVKRKMQASPGLGHSADSNHNNLRYTNSVEFSLELDEEIEEDYLTDTAEAATAKFLLEQEKRTRELELQLDDHIEKLRNNTHVTVQKLSESH